MNMTALSNATGAATAPPHSATKSATAAVKNASAKPAKTRQRKKPHRSWWLLPVALLAAAAIFAAGWALRVLFAPPPPLPAPISTTTVTAAKDTISRTISLPVTATWQDGVDVLATGSGTLTQLLADSAAPVSEGQAIFSLNMQPAILAQGAVPAYRDIGPAAEGEDVAQLQRFLNRQGFNAGAENGTFHAGTAQAVRRWQKQTGQEITGSVPLGSLIFTPQLPASLGWADKLKVGKQIAAGDKIAQLSGSQLRFTMPLPDGQLRLVREGMAVAIRPQDKEWHAVIGEINTGADGEAVATLYPAADAESVCGAECAIIPALGSEGINAEITLIAPVTGVAVPNAALQLGKDGAVVVQDARGKNHRVKVLTTAGGKTIVQGIKAGMRVRVQLGEGGSTTPSPVGGSANGGAGSSAGNETSPQQNGAGQS